MQYGQITLINMIDKYNPYVISKYANEDENTWNACATHDGAFIFIQTVLGIRIFPLIS